MHDKVTRLRQLMSEALPRDPQPTPTETLARAAFAYFEANAPQQPVVLDQSPKARAIRTVMRIATWYGWMTEVERALDAAGCSALSDLDQADLDELSARMIQLEDCAQHGMGAPDAPPAV